VNAYSDRPYIPYSPTPKPPYWKYALIVLGVIILGGLLVRSAFPAEVDYSEFSNEEISQAIYFAEGGAKTRHPYGILAHYKHTTPRQACINTIIHARKDWNGRGDFIDFLGSRYAPIGVSNDPTGLNKNWIRNVKRLLQKGGR